MIALLFRVCAFVVLVVAAVAPGTFGAPGLADVWRWVFGAFALLVLAQIIPEVP